MAEAFICDYVRTPIGRFGGALAAVRADDLAAVPLQALIARPGSGRGRRRGPRLRQSGRRGQPQRRAHGAPARRPAEEVPGATVNRLCGSGMDALADRGARDQGGRGGPRDRGRRREHVARAVRHAQGRERVLAPGRDPRHDARLALRQPAARGAVRRRFDARDRRERRREFQVTREDQDAFALRSQQRAAAARRAAARQEIAPVTVPQRRGEPVVVERRRASAPATRRSSSSQACRRVPPEAARSPPATPRASTTARRRCLVASEAARGRHGLEPLARVVGGAAPACRPGHGHRPGAGHAEAVRAPGWRSTRSR